MIGDLLTVIRWWIVLMAVGGAAWPLTAWWFGKWYDHGYAMAKAVGIGAVTFGVWILGSMRIMEFSTAGVGLVIGVLWLGGRVVGKGGGKRENKIILIIAEELFFLLLLIGWTWVKAHEPMIRGEGGLEKFMDFGFTRSILQGKYFPPADMWFSGEPINYYYFGHLAMAVLTKLSGLPLFETFNLMLATLFALCFSMSASIGGQLLRNRGRLAKWTGALLIAFLVTLSGNLHTIYAFTKGSGLENPVPFWKIMATGREEIKAGWRGYWYPNATRFIPYSIHEFPSYSFVVSDVHGHVLDVPWVLLAIGMLVVIFAKSEEKVGWGILVGYGWVAGWMFMTNALDGPIYLGLFAILAITRNFKLNFERKNLKRVAKELGVVLVVFVVTVTPFMKHFKPFVSGVAVNCPPAILANSRLGPLLFEGVEKCQRSAWWMLFVLWGFLIYCGGWLWFGKPKNWQARVVWLFCLALIIFPEFFYFKDIYPAHFRSNTMFKLGYQAFIMLSFLSGYAITTAVWQKRWWFVAGAIPGLFLVSIYPYFSINSYFGRLKNYQGVGGVGWIEEKYPDDWTAIKWLNQAVKPGEQPVIVEAGGDSYTDFERISTFTGLPTIAGWVVHEWLWRGGYETIAARGEEVRQIYEGGEAKAILSKYKVKYVIVGELERRKYPRLDEKKLLTLAEKVFVSGGTTIYRVVGR